MIWRTPGMALALVSSTLASLPPNTGQAASVATFMSGSRTSMPNCAVPSTLAGASTRFAGVLEPHVGQIDLQLLGQEHGHGRIRPLSHFDLVHDQRHATVAVDANEGVGLEGGGRRRRQLEAEQQAAADSDTDAEELPTRHTRRADHVSLPPPV